MTIAYPCRAFLAVLFFALVSNACSNGSTKNSPDAQPDIGSATDTSIVNPPDSAQAGPQLVIAPPIAHLLIGQATTFNVGNIGDTPVGPLTLKITGDHAMDFAATPTGCDFVAPSAFCTVDVVYTRTDYLCGFSTASLVVTGPAPDFATASAALLGGPTSIPNPLRLSSLTSDLGSVPVGFTGPAGTFTLTYGGTPCASDTGPLTVTLSSGEFVITDDACSTKVLPTGGTCTLGAALRPTSPGAKSTYLSVTDPAGRSTGATVTGTGLPAIDGGLVETMDSGLDLAEAGHIAMDGGWGN